MYGYENGGSGIRPMRPQPADDLIQQMRMRRASRDQQMAPPSVTPMPEALEPLPQHGKGMAAQMLDMGTKALAEYQAENSDDENQQKALEQMKTPSFVPGSESSAPTRPSPLPPSLPMGQSSAAPPMATPQMSTPLPARPTPPPMIRQGGQETVQLPNELTPPRPTMQQMPNGLTSPDMPAMAPQRPDTIDPIEKARLDAVYGAGVRLPPKRGFWDTLKTAGVGALQGMASGGGIGGAIGGALAGGITSAISPEAGRDYRFDILQRPKMERQQDRQAQMSKQVQALIKSGADINLINAQIAKMNAEAAALPGRTRREEEFRQSQIGLNQARTESARNPRPKYTPEEDARLRERHDAEMRRINSVIERNKRGPARGGGGGGGGRQAVEKTKGPASGAIRFAQDVEEALQIARKAADTAFKEKTPAAQTEAQVALEDYQRLVRDLGNLYPEDYETGQGTQPGPNGTTIPAKEWPYYKARPRGGR
jgi:hypothetical protein